MKSWVSFAIFIILLSLGFLISVFLKSSSYMKMGDESLAEGDTITAIADYQKAKEFFPFRLDIQESIDGANLVLKSQAEINGISDFVGEVQEVPPVPEIPAQPTPTHGQVYVPILMYHHVGANPFPNDRVWSILTVSDNQLDQQLKSLVSRGYHVITLTDLYNYFSGRFILPEKPVILTFDDGYRTFYNNAFPLLKKYHLRATQFVITRAVGAPAYLTWDEIVEMDKSGLVDFGGHTQHHPNLPDVSLAKASEEIAGSKADLESHLGHPINFFAYPYGSYTQGIIGEVRKAGFLGAVSTIYGGIQDSQNLFLLQRIQIDGREGLDSFAKRVQ